LVILSPDQKPLVIFSWASATLLASQRLLHRTPKFWNFGPSSPSWIWTSLLDVRLISIGPKCQSLPPFGNGFDLSSLYVLLLVIISMTTSTRSNLAVRSSLDLGPSRRILRPLALTPLAWAAGPGFASRVAQVTVSILCVATVPTKLRKPAFNQFTPSSSAIWNP